MAKPCNNNKFAFHEYSFHPSLVRQGLMPPPLHIAIFTSGRFHVCDLARELAVRGHDVAFYSWVPPWRTRKFGLPSKCNRWLLPYLGQWFAAARVSRGTRFAEWTNRHLLEAYDRVGVSMVEPCDVFIGMSGMCNRVGAAVRRKWGAKVWIERGSRHIRSQKAILDAIPGADRVKDYQVKREEADYAQADVVSVLSRHCEESFLEQGFSPNKLVRNPLGVNLSMFVPTPAPPSDPPTVITAGAWSLRKGCDVLTAAWQMLPGVKLMHVGPVTDCPLPSGLWFEQVPKVDQSRLPEIYKRAHVFAMASREEGLATVQPQALACGLRLVCTDRTGGADLAEMLPDPRSVRVVPADNAVSLADAMKESLLDARKDVGLRDHLGSGREHLSWAAYGQRYEAALRERI